MGNDTTAIVSQSGGAIVAWTDLRPGSFGIRAQRLDSDGTVQWGPDGVAVNSTMSVQYGLGLASDGATGALLSWHDGRNGPLDIYAQSLDGNGIPRWGTTGIAVCTAAGYQFSSIVVNDGLGGAVLAWPDLRSGPSDVYAQRVREVGSLDVPMPAGAGLLLAPPSPSPARADRGASIGFGLASAGAVRLSVLDVAGRELRVLADGPRAAGEQSVHWDARDDAGRTVSPGLYFIRLRAAGRVAATRLVIAR